jgi:hypothetical protein
MTIYVECKNLLRLESLILFDETFEPVGEITFPSNRQDNILVSLYGKAYTVESNWFKPLMRFVITEQGTTNKAIVKVGVKILHAVVEQDKYYFAKAAFFKLFYQLYDDRELLGECDLIRHDDIRYYRITNTKDDALQLLALFFLAHAVRLKSIITYEETV